MTLDSSSYINREQTYIKHLILDRYLERFAHIIGYHWESIAYVDCFSGPWESADSGLRDTSFSIAVEKFRKAKADLASNGRTPRVRCLFLEKDATAYRQLEAFARSATDVEAQALHTEVEKAVPDILEFVHESGRDTFSFLFFDPTGWTGFALDVITPLLQLQPGEVLINFMTHHIRRFIDLDETAESFVRLFGSDVRSQLRDLPPQEREEKLLGSYMRAVKERGGFSYVGAAIIFKPVAETTHFHLIYATRGMKGIKEFKRIEERTMPVAAQVRAASKKRLRLERTDQYSLDLPSDQSSPLMAELRNRYMQKAYARVEEVLVKDREVRYQRLWRRAVAFPLVWERDLREWLRLWKAAGRIDVVGLYGRQQPTTDRDNLVVWRG